MPRAYCEAFDCEYMSCDECYADEVFLDKNGKCKIYKRKKSKNNE